MSARADGFARSSAAESVPVAVKNGKTGDGISLKAAKIIRGLMPIRDAVRDVLRAQAAGQPWKELQVRLRTCYSNFIRYYGPINHTVVSTLTDDETGGGSASNTAARTWRTSPTIRIAGWSPPSKTTTSTPAMPAWVRSSANAWCLRRRCR